MKLFVKYQIVLLSLIFIQFVCLFAVVDDFDKIQREYEIKLKQYEYYIQELQSNFEKLYRCYKTDEIIEELGWEEINRLETEFIE